MEGSSLQLVCRLQSISSNMVVLVVETFIRLLGAQAMEMNCSRRTYSPLLLGLNWSSSIQNQWKLQSVHWLKLLITQLPRLLFRRLRSEELVMGSILAFVKDKFLEPFVDGERHRILGLANIRGPT